MRDADVVDAIVQKDCATTAIKSNTATTSSERDVDGRGFKRAWQRVMCNQLSGGCRVDEPGSVSARDLARPRGRRAGRPPRMRSRTISTPTIFAAHLVSESQTMRAIEVPLWLVDRLPV